MKTKKSNEKSDLPGVFGEIRSQILANNRNGSLDFINKAITSFATKYSAIKYSYEVLFTVALDCSRESIYSTEQVRDFIVVYRNFFELIISLCRKLEKYIPSPQAEFYFDFSLPVKIDLNTQLANKRILIDRISQKTLQIAMDLYIKCSNAKIKRYNGKKEKADLTSFPCSSDLYDNARVAMENVKKIKMLIIDICNLLLKDMNHVSKNENLDDSSALNVALTKMREHLEKCEETFADRVTFFHIAYSLMSEEDRNRLAEAVRSRSDEFSMLLNDGENISPPNTEAGSVM